MTLPAPHYPLVPSPVGVLSSYDRQGRTGGPRASLVPLSERPGAQVAPWCAGSLAALHGRAEANGWDLRVTEAWRSVSAQAQARTDYLAGKRAAFVAPAGRSCHGAGCAIDVHTGPLAASGATLAGWHEAARLAGWRPIIATDSPRGWATSESWHLDCWGPLEGIRRRMGYSQAAMAAHLLTGQWGHLLPSWGPQRVSVAVLQASLQRAGHDCGEVDGYAGTATLAAMVAAGIEQGQPWHDAATAAYGLPTDLALDTVRAA